MKKFLLICCGILFLFDVGDIVQVFSGNGKNEPLIIAVQHQKNAIEKPSSTPLNEQDQLNTTASDTAKIISSMPLIPQTPDQIFDYVDPLKAAEKNTNPNEYSILATGDVIPARSVNAALVRRNNFTFPFEKTIEVLKSADAVFINLESPLVQGCQVVTSGMSFCGDPRAVAGFTYAGVSVASIANNHAGNYGASGIVETVKALKKNHIAVTGNGEAATLTIRGKKFGFLGYNTIGRKEDGIAWADTAQLKQDIQALKKQVDIVLVTFHWGTEYTSTPHTISERVCA